MAKFKVVISGGKVVIQSYQTEDAILENTTLKIKTFKAYTKEWAEFILANRNNHSDIPVHDYDIVVANGQNKLKDKIFRMGTLGYVSERDAITAIGALEATLYKLGHKFELGAGCV